MSRRHDPVPDATDRPARFAQLLRQGAGFGAVGGLQLLLDWGVMIALSAAGLPLPAANVAGRAAGACLGFWANRHITFQGHEHAPMPQLVRFLVLWSVLTVVSTLSLILVAQHGSLAGAWALKPLIEASLAVVSFFSCRQWVYR
ncbi:MULTISPECIES: GtrA family protein [Oleiagrimonas]|jgi:putative flippase GtrA|uniref:GtrA family protein n=1 Tax=Oleiagrimonas citrea TaxID=1665687 RepID=A0A846ZQD0_9GAMM|nr:MULTISPECIES: GtrA family protein [Oleiagrimonas]NKZ39857.1 GtrA family protein [Oleiagrimonas citrea]RAP57018.1 hypothetical protein BTJ49_12230 [Oleiagrimonas sp. MCCC 1A03011]